MPLPCKPPRRKIEPIPPKGHAMSIDTNSTFFDRIKDDVTQNPVLLFMKGTPVFPQCGFSAAVVQILTEIGVKFKGVDVLADPEIRQGIKEFSNWPTIPQLYVKGEFVGGCDIIREMYEAGELQDLLKEKGIATRA
jgi:monothiol glutaredoxin